MTGPFAGAMLLFSVEPTDRALAGWCALPPHLVTETRALDWLRAGSGFPGGLYGDTRYSRPD